MAAMIFCLCVVSGFFIGRRVNLVVMALVDRR